MLKYCPGCSKEADLIHEFGVCASCFTAGVYKAKARARVVHCTWCKIPIIPAVERRNMCGTCLEKSIEQKRLAATPTQEGWEKMKAYFNHRCLACGKLALFLTKDHVIPKARGGPNSLENYQPLCLACNLHKGGVETIDYRWPGWREALALPG